MGSSVSDGRMKIVNPRGETASTESMNLYILLVQLDGIYNKCPKNVRAALSFDMVTLLSADDSLSNARYTDAVICL